MKRFLLSSLAVVAMGVGMAFSQTTTSTLTLASGNLSGLTATSPKTLTTNDGVSWNFSMTGSGTLQNFDGAKGQQFGSKNSPISALTIKTSSLSDKTIKAVTINTSCASSGNTTLTVKVGDVAFKNGTNESYQLTTTATDVKFEGDASGEIVISYAVSARAMYVKSIVVEYADAPTRTPVNLAFAQSEIEVVKDDMVALPALTGLPEDVTLDVTYTSSNPDIANVEEGHIFAYAEGTATITATTRATDTYAAGEATLTVTVVDKADTRLDAGLSFSEESVTAYVDQEDFTAPTLTKATTAAVVYSSSNHDVAVVDPATGEVIIGAAGTAVITATAAENTEYKAGTASYTIVVSKIASQLAFAETAVEKYLGSSEYGEFPVLANPADIEVSYTSSNTEVATVAADGAVTIVAAGATTITAAPADANKYEGTASYTLTVTDASIGAGSGTYELLTDVNALNGKKGLIVNDTKKQAAGALNNGYFPAVSVTFENGVITGIGDAQVITFVEGTTAGEFALQISDTEYLVWDSSTKMKIATTAAYYPITLSSQKNATIQVFTSTTSASDRSIQWASSSNGTFRAYAVGGQTAVQIYVEAAGQGVVAPEVTPSFEELSDGKYMASFEVEEGVSVYYSIVSESLTRVAGKDGLEYTKYTEPFEVEDNQTLNYYSELKGVQSETKSMLINKQTTGVENILVDQDSASEYYDLQGRRVVNPANGIFIRRQGSTVTKVAL